MYMFLLVSGLIASILNVGYRLRRYGLEALAYDPIILFSIYYGIVHFLTPLAKANADRFRFASGYDTMSSIYTASLTLICYAIAVISSDLFSRPTYQFIRSRRVQAVSYRSLDWTIVGGSILLAIGIFFLLSDINAISSAAGDTSSFLADRHLYSKDRFTTRVLSNFLISASGLLLIAVLYGRYRILALALWAISIFGLITYANATSSRNIILITALANIVVYQFFRLNKGRQSVRKTRGITAYAAIFAVIVATCYIGFQTTLARYSISDNLYLLERRDNVLFYALDGAFGNDEALLWMSQYDDYPLLFGKTYLAAFTNVVPRSIWAEKPLGGGPELINMIRPGSYVIGETGNNSLTTGLLVEARMNFGVLGMFFSVILWSYLSNLFGRRAQRSKELVRRLSWLFLLIFFSSSFIYSEALGFVVRSAIVVAPLFILSFFVSTKRDGYSGKAANLSS